MNAESLLNEIRDDAGQLWQGPLYFVPIRHHSPACSYALHQLLHEIKPRTVLIEGPWDCQGLITSLQHSETTPPVALLTQRGAGEELYSAYFPLCEYSPEWVALRTAHSLGAATHFIDLPYGERPSPEVEERVHSLMTERYFQHSQYLKAIAARLGCRDHDEGWDRLFEQRPLEQLNDWRNFFTDVFAYCALARRDYEEEVIAASGDKEREAFMAARIGEALKSSEGPYVVVTGGFHTPALMQPIDKRARRAVPKARKEASNWLIRYSFDQLDALNGYGAGMPSPGYYQVLWDNLKKQQPDYLQQSASAQLIAIAHDNRAQQLARLISSSEVQAAFFQAEQLARLRGSAGPGRSEVMDAVHSCYLKDAVDYSASLLSDVRRVMCGDRLGDIPRQSGQPPLLREAWQRGEALALDFSQTQVKTLDLDLYRKERHRELSRYLHLMDWIGSGLGQWQGGPDFVNGHQLGLMREQWRYAWTPQVEARLLDRMLEGASLEQVALKRLKGIESTLSAAGNGRRADTAATLLLRACVMGLHHHVTDLSARLHTLIADDEHLASVIACAHKLITLERGRAVLESERLAIDLLPMAHQCWRNALFLLPRLGELKAEEAAHMISALPELLALTRELNEDKALLYQVLGEMLHHKGAPAVVHGAVLGALFQTGALTSEELLKNIEPYLQVNQPPEQAVGCLQGLMHVARETLWRIPEILQALNRLIDDWPESHFLSLLPPLRMLFTELSPKELDTVAQQLADLNGLTDAAQLTDATLELNPRELALLAQLDGYVAAAIERAGLSRWYINEAE